MSDYDKGLYNKFTVIRNDGSSEIGEKHYGCNYFVLDLTHDKFAAPALGEYARACRYEFPFLAADLLNMIKDLPFGLLPRESRVCPACGTHLIFILEQGKLYTMTHTQPAHCEICKRNYYILL